MPYLVFNTGVNYFIYIVAHSRSNDDYADFVVGLAKETGLIDTTKENLQKIIDLAIGSLSLFKEINNKQNHAV